MKTIILNEFGGTENLLYTEMPTPELNDNEVLIQVKAMSINPVDVKTRQGKGLAGRMKEFKPLILGWDISGVVVKAGNRVSKFKTGDEVFGMVNFPGHGKGYSEYVASPESHLALKPANISHEEAAAATLAALTAWQAWTVQANIKPGTRVLVHAAAGGVGHYAVQLAKHFGAYVIGTASASNRDFMLGLGADEHFDYHSGPFEEAIKDIDLVLDGVGGDITERSIKVVRHGGKIINIPSGVSPEVAEKAKAAGVEATWFLVNSNGSDMEQLAILLTNKKLISHVSATFAFKEMEKAHLSVETGRTIGKVVVTF